MHEWRRNNRGLSTRRVVSQRALVVASGEEERQRMWILWGGGVSWQENGLGNADILASRSIAGRAEQTMGRIDGVRG